MEIMVPCIQIIIVETSQFCASASSNKRSLEDEVLEGYPTISYR